MVCFRVPFTSLLTVIVFSFTVSIATGDDDLKCLQGVKKSPRDPLGKLSSWTFTNTSAGALCNYTGVSCWNDRDNRLFGLEIRDMKLVGDIPEPLHFCHSLQSLDLSGNQLTGSIPAQICTWCPFLVTLNLSDNQLTGPISAELANCSYLNTLILSDNKLSGTIPTQFSSLLRLKKFSVANNDLSGTIPSFFGSYNSTDFVGDNGLRGRPLEKGGGLKRKDVAIIIAAGVSGAVASMLLSMLLVWFCCFTKRSKG